MSRLTDLIAQAKAKDPQMGADLEREFRALSSRRSFGLNFERHRPENVELPQRPVRKGDKVRVPAFFKIVAIICLLIKQLLFLDLGGLHQLVHSS